MNTIHTREKIQSLIEKEKISFAPGVLNKFCKIEFKKIPKNYRMPYRTARKHILAGTYVDPKAVSDNTAPNADICVLAKNGFLFFIEHKNFTALIKEVFQAPAQVRKQVSEIVEKIKDQKKDSPLDMTKLYFTIHAVAQFKARYPKLSNTDAQFPEQKMRLLFIESSEEGAIAEQHRIYRSTKHGIAARYFAIHNWRFVVHQNADGTYSVITFEPRDKTNKN